MWSKVIYGTQKHQGSDHINTSLSSSAIMVTKLLTAHFTTNGVPRVGLTPSVVVHELSTIDPLSNPIVSTGTADEIGTGWYRYSFVGYDRVKNYVFTFDGGSTLVAHERYKHGGNETHVEDIAPAVWDEQATNHVANGSVGLTLSQIKADTATISLNDTTMAALLNTILKYHRNRTRINLNAAQLIIYDDDGITPLTTFSLKDFNGMPNVQEVCEKIPTT